MSKLGAAFRTLNFPALLVALSLAPSFGCGGNDNSGGDPSTMDAEDVVNVGCAGDGDCPGGRCVAGLPGGLCTANCGDQGECPEGTVCTDTEAVGGVCLFPCSSAGECTDLLGAGYTCDEETNINTGEDIRVCIDA